MNNKSLMSYFLIPIIMCIIFVSIMFFLAVFSPKNVVLKIYGYDGQEAYAIYRAPKEGNELYTHLEKVAVPGKKFDGYYFKRTETAQQDGSVVYTFDEAYKVPENYIIEEDITLYVKWIKVTE